MVAQRPERNPDLRTASCGSTTQGPHNEARPRPYEPSAAAPAWDAFVERVLPERGGPRLRPAAVGYSATGDTSEQCIFIHYGLGQNGKSTFQEAIAAALGDYAMKTPTDTLLGQAFRRRPNDVARLKGARFVTASETEEGRRLV